MEQDKQNLLELIDRPAFLVREGIICQCNQMAKNRQIPLGAPVGQVMPEDCDAYKNYHGGTLYLTLQLGWIRCGATVIRQADADIFLLDREPDNQQLQALALAAQQLRTPLSNVMTLAECLFPDLQEETQKEKASQMSRGLFQLMRLISNMADATRYTSMETGDFENTELSGFFRQIVEKADCALEDARTRIRFSCPEVPVFTVLDRELIERAVYNLLSNAVKFSAAGSTIDVKLSCNGKMACLTVEDHGEGVAAHVQGSLFHRYLREPAIEDSRFGLGLGMTLVRSAAAMHGGTVLLEQSSGTRVAMTIAIREKAPGELHSPRLRIGDYAGGRDLGLLEFSETLPAASYEKNM